MPDDLRQIFDAEFSKPPSEIEARAAAAALGDEYPAGLGTYSWVSRTELARAAGEIEGAGTVVDLGCGRGGPGLWVAGVVGAPLVGIDISEAGLVRARELARLLGVEADFRLGSFDATGLADSSTDALLSFDAFLFAEHKAAAFHELARVVRPGGTLVMTSWDYHAQPENRPPQVPDHRPLAEDAGFLVRAYEDTDDWLARCTGFADYLLAHIDEIAEEDGMAADEVEADVRAMRATMDCMSRRFLLVAQRRGPDPS